MSHGLNCPVCGSGEFGDCVCPIDRQQHIDTLARAVIVTWERVEVAHLTSEGRLNPSFVATFADMARSLFDSTDPAVHDALTAALIAHADRGRVLAALADAGWLDTDVRSRMEHFTPAPGGTGMRSVYDARYVSRWEPTP